MFLIKKYYTFFSMTYTCTLYTYLLLKSFCFYSNFYVDIDQILNVQLDVLEALIKQCEDKENAKEGWFLGVDFNRLSYGFTHANPK